MGLEGEGCEWESCTGDARLVKSTQTARRHPQVFWHSVPGTFMSLRDESLACTH